MRDLLFVARKDLFYMLKGKETLLWIFVMPIVFFFFIGTVTGQFAGSGDSKPVLALQASEDAGFVLDQLVHHLTARDFEIVQVSTDEEAAPYGRRLIVPPAFTDSVLTGRPVTLRFSHSQEELGGDYEAIRAGRAVYSLLADLIVSGRQTGGLTPETLIQLNEMPRSLQLEATPAGERLDPPTGFEQTIPGVMVMFVLMVMATSGAVLLVIERRQGLLRRLACTPISRLSVVLGKWGGKLVLGIVQIAFAMLAGTVLFKMAWGPNLPFVVLVMVCYGFMMAALGVVLGSVARTEGVAVAIGVVSANVLAALGGCWWPIEITPAWMQKLQLFLPTGWAMDALHKLISFELAPASVVPHTVGMLVATAVLVVVAVKVFRYE